MGFSGKNTGVGCHFLHQGIFQTQGLNLYLLRWQVDSLPLAPSGNPCLSHPVNSVISWQPALFKRNLSPLTQIIFFSSTCNTLIVNIKWSIATAAKSCQLCPTLCNPQDGSPPGYPVPEIFQARTLEWVAISFSNAWKWKVKVKSPSRVWLLATPWTVAYQASPSMGFSRQEYWSGVPLPSPNEALLDPKGEIMLLLLFSH